MVSPPNFQSSRFPASTLWTVWSRPAVAIVLLMVSGIIACASEGTMADGLAAAKKGDYEAAYEIWLSLAEDGNTAAQYNVAQLYRRGAGVTRDYARAAEWYAEAAEHFHPPARYNLALLYEKGLGVPIDYAQARKWYRLAANQGYRPAQFNLGVMYSIGQGTEPDLPQAHMWFTLAARQGDAGAKSNLERLIPHMSEEQLARAKDMLEEWEHTWG